MDNHLTGRIEFARVERDACLENGDVSRASLHRNEWTAVLGEHAEYLLSCYVDTEVLERQAEAEGIATADFLRNNVLPDKNHIRSGNFGEILMQAVISGSDDVEYPLRKLRLRWRRDDTPKGTDLIGVVVQEIDNPSPEDTLVVCEVKTRAKTISNVVLRNAFDGVVNDAYSRLADSLTFQSLVLRESGDDESADVLSRFKNPLKHGRYRLVLIAACVHESSTWDDVFFDELPERHELEADVECRVLDVHDLWDWIESTEDAACALLESSIPEAAGEQ